MIYPIVIYGSQTLRNKSVDITPDYPELKKLIDDMFLTLTEASGVGLAAPQIGKNIRLFIVIVIQQIICRNMEQLADLQYVLRIGQCGAVFPTADCLP